MNTERLVSSQNLLLALKGSVQFLILILELFY